MHAYVGTCANDRRQMMRHLGIASVEEVLRAIPESVRLRGGLDLPAGGSELSVRRELGALADRNWDGERYASFLGGGAYDHYIPSAIAHLASRSEFYTAYTPYQAEASQGTLMAIFEFQSLLCELLALDVANASLYDGGSAVAEAALLGLRARPGPVVRTAGLHPRYARVLGTYCGSLGEIRTAPSADGITDVGALESALAGASTVIVQNPNFYGLVEPVEEIARAAKAAGALVVAVVDPLTLGVLAPPGEWGADVAVGEGQGLGNELSFGGPYLGFLASRRDHLRRLPGRIAGVTTGRKGERGFVLTLQTREQHIRREKATSNICTNQGLMMLRATIYMALLGRSGIVEVGRQCLAKSRYAAGLATKIPGYRLRFGGAFVKEFVLDCPVPAERVVASAARRGILPGVDLGRFDPAMSRSLLVAVTEKRTREEIDAWAAALGEAAR